MAISLSSIVQRNVGSKPPRVLIYGVSGVGKTTFAAQAPEPLLVPLEDGLGLLDVAHTPIPTTLNALYAVLDALATEQHGYKTVIIDSLDWLEPLIYAHVCAKHNWPNIEAPGYGKGYKAATDTWREYLGKLDALRDSGMFVLQIAHANIKRFDAPDSESYDRYNVKLHEHASALVKEWSDIVLFANYVVATKSNKTGTTVRGVGIGERVAYTSERPAYVAKNRHRLPHQVPLNWQAFISAIGTAND